MLDYRAPSTSRSRVPKPVKQVVRGLLGFFVSIGIVGIFVGFWSLYGLGGIVGLGLGLWTSISLGWAIRRALRATHAGGAARAIITIEQAVRIGLPLNEALRAAAMSETKTTQQRFRELSVLIEEGVDLGSAFRSVFPFTGQRFAARIASAGDPSTLRNVLKQEVDDLDRIESMRPRIDVVLIYFVLMLGMVGGVYAWILYFVFPKLHEITKDFNTGLSPMLSLIGNYWVMILAFVAMSISAIFLFGLMLRMIGGTLGFGGPVLSDGRNWARSLARRFGGLFPQVHLDLADVCSTLASQVRSGAPLPDALRAAAMPHLGSKLNRSLIDTSKRIEQGESFADASRASHLPKRIAELSSLARGSELLADGFDMLARWHNQLADDRTRMLVRVLPVIATAIIALLVIPTIYGVLDTEVRLFDVLTPDVYKW